MIRLAWSNPGPRRGFLSRCLRRVRLRRWPGDNVIYLFWDTVW